MSRRIGDDVPDDLRDDVRGREPARWTARAGSDARGPEAAPEDRAAALLRRGAPRIAVDEARLARLRRATTTGAAAARPGRRRLALGAALATALAATVASAVVLTTRDRGSVERAAPTRSVPPAERRRGPARPQPPAAPLPGGTPSAGAPPPGGGAPAAGAPLAADGPGAEAAPERRAATSPAPADRARPPTRPPGAPARRLAAAAPLAARPPAAPPAARPPAALPAAEPAAPGDDPSAALAEALRRLRRDRDPAGALALVERHAPRLAGGPLALEAASARVEALLALGRRDEALGALDRLRLDGAPGAGALRVVRGELRASRGRCAEARADFSAALDLPALAGALGERALYGRASCSGRLGDAAAARRDLAAYLRRFPDGRFAREAAAAAGPGR